MRTAFSSLLVVIVLCSVLSGCASTEERRDQFFSQAEELFEQERYEEAKVQAKNAKKLDREYVPTHVLLGNINMKLESYRDAFNNYSKALVLDPGYTDAGIGLARLQLMSGNLDDAVGALDKVLAAEPDNRDAQLLVAVILSRRGELDAAMEQARQISTEHPDFEDAWALMALLEVQKGNPGQAVDILRQALEALPDSRNLALQLAGTLTGMERFDEAAALYERVAQDNPEDQKIRSLLSRFYQRTGKTEKALEVARGLVRDFPDKEEFYLALAGLLQAAGEEQEQERVLREGIEAVDDSGRMQIGLVQLLASTGRLDEAMDEAQAMAEADPEGDIGIAARKMLVEMDISRMRLDEAWAGLEKILMVRPGDPDALIQQARIHVFRGDMEDAVILYRTVLEQEPGLLPVYKLLARAHLAQNRPLLARKNLEQALVQNPTFASGRQMLVDMLLAAREYDAALMQLRAALENAPGNPNIQAAIGDVLVLAGRPGQAKQEFEKLLEDPRTAGFGMFKLGRLALSRQDLEQALAIFTRLHEVAPQSFQAAEAVVIAQLASGAPERAREFAAGLEGVLPGAGADILLGQVAAAKGDLKVAERHYLAGGAKDPGFDALLKIGTMYLSAGKQDQALERFEKAHADDPENVDALYVLGMIHQQSGEDVKAERAYLDLLKIRPRFVPALNNLAYLYADSEVLGIKLDEALDLALKASASGAPEALDTLGWVYHLRGNDGMALSTLMQALEQRPEDPAVLVHLALVHEALGNAGQAGDYARLAVEKGPGSEGARQAAEVLDRLP